MQYRMQLKDQDQLIILLSQAMILLRVLAIN